MARARNIKPGFFTNELLGTYDPIISLMFAGLWCLADKEGILEDRPLRIKAELFPYREGLDINGYLTVLERDGFLTRYVVDGVRYIQIENFEKHQHPHHTEKPRGFPKPQAKAGKQTLTPLNNGDTPSDLLIPDSLIPDSLIHVETSCASSTKRSSQVPANFQPNETCLALAGELGVPVEVELPKFIDHHVGKGSLQKDWQATFRTWLRNSVKFNGYTPANRGDCGGIPAKMFAN